MSKFVEKYRKLSNLDLKRLLSQRDRLDETASAAALREAEQRGMPLPPIRQPSTTPQKQPSWWAQNLKKWEIQPRDKERYRSDVLDVTIASGEERYYRPDSVKLLTGGFIVYSLLFALADVSFVIQAHYTTLSSDLEGLIDLFSNYSKPWTTLLKYLINLGVIIGLLRGHYRGLAGVAFFAGFGGMGVISRLVGPIAGGYLVDLIRDFAYLGFGILLQALIYVFFYLFSIRVEVTKYFGVGPKFSQSYLMIGITLGILFQVLVVLGLPYIWLLL